MKQLIDQYSKGKIEIKFHLIKPLISNALRKNSLIVLSFLMVFFIFIVIPKTLQILKIDSFTSILIFLILSLIFFDVLTRIFLFKIKEIGVIKFLSETIEIQKTDLDRAKEIIAYSEIIKIRYQRNVPKTVLTKSPDTKTFIVEFILIEKPSVFVEIEDKMFLLEEDFNQFRTNEPNLETVLNYVKPKHGLEIVKKIKLPIDFYQI